MHAPICCCVTGGWHRLCRSCNRFEQNNCNECFIFKKIIYFSSPFSTAFSFPFSVRCLASPCRHSSFCPDSQCNALSLLVDIVVLPPSCPRRARISCPKFHPVPISLAWTTETVDFCSNYRRCRMRPTKWNPIWFCRAMSPRTTVVWNQLRSLG